MSFSNTDLVESSVEIYFGEYLATREAICKGFSRWNGAAIFNSNCVKGMIVNTWLFGAIRFGNKEDR